MAGEERVFAIEHDGTDASFDDVGVEFDAAIIEEPRQPFPMMQCVADGLCGFGFARKTRELVFEPGLELEYQRLASFLTDCTALLGASPADRLLDQIELRDPFERFARDRRVAVLLEIIELPAQMRPAEGKRDRLAASLAGDRLVGRISVALHHPAISIEQLERMHGAATWCVGISDGGWITPAPGPVVAGNCPEVSFLDLPAS